MRRVYCSALAACCLASPAYAQSAMPSPEDVANRDTLTLAGGAALLPDYEGSNEYRLIPAAAVRASYHGISFTSRGLYLYVDVIRQSAKFNFDAGPIVGGRFGRRKHIKDEVVALLPHRKNAIEVGGFAGVSLHGVTNPYDRLSLRFDALHD